VIIDHISYLSEIDGELQLTLNVDRNKGSYTFENSGLKLAGLQLQLKGNITDMDDHVMMDLALSSPKADLPSLLSLIPEKYRTGTGDYNYSGDVEFNGSFKGRSDASHSPLIAFSFVSKHANLNPKGTPYHLKNLNGKGYFTNRKNNAHPVTYLKLENFTGTLEGKPIRATVEIENFAKPRLSVSAEFEADLKALSNFFKPDTLESISGLAMIDATFNGISGEKSTYRSSGNIRFSNVDFHLKKKPVDFRNFNGLLHLEGNDLVVEELTGQAGGSDFRLTGSFHNLFAWLMAENQSLNITASLQSKNLHLDELMAKEIETSPSHEDTVYRLNFSEKIRLDLEVSIGQLQFRKFMASDLNGTVALENKKLITRELDFNTSDGSVKLKGSIDNQLSDSLKISYDAMINNLDINKLFYEMGNFGQEVIVDKNLKGRVTAQVVFKSSWSNRLELNENSIYARSNITIENGELINFTPLLALSRFLKGSDLKTVKFSTLTNIIEIKDRKINIPLMEIKSSAIDITTIGQHSFDNIVDYKLRLYLSQIMGRKVREQNTEFGTIEDDGVGRPMVYLSMKGKASDPKFTWDRASVGEKD
jgi:autotransporter translocation and assembly factor TamB